MVSKISELANKQQYFVDLEDIVHYQLSPEIRSGQGFSHQGVLHVMH